MAAGDLVSIGLQDFTEQPKEYRYDNGYWKLIRRWEGPPDLLVTAMQTVQATTIPDSIVAVQGVPGTIQATYGDQDPTSNTPPEVAAEDAAVWELLVPQLEKGLRTHGQFLISGVSVSVMEEIDEAIRKGFARNVDWAAKFGGAIGAAAQKYCNYRLRGVDSYISFSFVVRKTLSFSNPVNLQAMFANANEIPGKVIGWNAIGVPAAAKFQQPKIHLFDENAQAFQDRPINEWLVMGADVQWDKVKNIWTIRRDWMGAEAWADLYDGGSWIP